MGIFHNMTEVRNLAPVPLNIRFDGQEIAVPPGKTFIPKVTVLYAMNQNPIMGTADADNPNISGGKYLIVPVGSKYDREPLTEEEWTAHLNKPCRIDEEAFFADRLGPREKMVTRGRGRKVQAKSRFEAGVASEANESIDAIAAEK